MSPRSGIDLPTVLQTATKIADAKGWESLTLASLAQALNIRSPSLYNHISGLPELRARLAVYGGQLLTNDMTRAAVGLAGDDAVRSMGTAYLSFARTHPGLYEGVQHVPHQDDPQWQQVAQNLVDVVAQVFRHYGLEGESAIHAVRGFRSLIHGFTSLERAGGFRIPLDVEISFRLLIDTFLAGIHVMKEFSSEEGEA